MRAAYVCMCLRCEACECWARLRSLSFKLQEFISKTLYLAVVFRMTNQHKEYSFYRSHRTNGHNDTCVDRRIFVFVRKAQFGTCLGPLDVRAAFIESRPVFHFFFLLSSFILLYRFLNFWNPMHRDEKGSSILKLKWCRRCVCVLMADQSLRHSGEEIM